MRLLSLLLFLDVFAKNPAFTGLDVFSRKWTTPKASIQERNDWHSALSEWWDSFN